MDCEKAKLNDRPWYIPLFLLIGWLGLFQDVILASRTSKWNHCGSTFRSSQVYTAINRYYPPSVAEIRNIYLLFTFSWWLIISGTSCVCIAQSVEVIPEQCVWNLQAGMTVACIHLCSHNTASLPSLVYSCISRRSFLSMSWMALNITMSYNTTRAFRLRRLTSPAWPVYTNVWHGTRNCIPSTLATL